MHCVGHRHGSRSMGTFASRCQRRWEQLADGAYRNHCGHVSRSTSSAAKHEAFAISAGPAGEGFLKREIGGRFCRDGEKKRGPPPPRGACFWGNVVSCVLFVGRGAWIPTIPREWALG